MPARDAPGPGAATTGRNPRGGRGGDLTTSRPSAARLAEDRAGTAQWRRWGAYLSLRQWGTVREDYSADGDAWASLPVRPRPRARVPLGRGRARGDLRPLAAPVLRGRALERARPDPQGAPLRRHQRRGQPRRGRQGALVAAGRHADAQPPGVALPLPARPLPLRTAPRRGRAPLARRARVRAARHRRPGRPPVHRRRRDLREGDAGRPRHPHRGHQPRAGAGPAARPADRVAAQHLDLGARHAPPASAAGPGRPARRRGRAPAAARLQPRGRG